MDFPPNSHSAKQKASREAPKRVERVTTADPKRRRKPLGKKFKSVFLSGDDANAAASYVLLHVLVPRAKDMLYEVGTTMFERIIFGGERSGRARSPYGGTGYVAYNQISRGPPDDRPPMPRRPTRADRARNNFDEVILDSRAEAEEVIDQLFNVVSQYERASVSDLYELVGIESTHVDYNWGWTDLQGATVTRVRTGGYLIDLPEPEPLT